MSATHAAENNAAVPPGALTGDGRNVGLTASAADRIAFLLREEGKPGAFLRIAVTGGGCSGFQYNFDFDETPQDDDFVIERDGATVRIDSVSLDLLAGSVVDYVEDMMSASFQVKNPNATSSCGCGSSFAI
ncbi:iron-sulfur cluster insertion protein ErpA [Zavarzinia compransoris]|uniref:Iron-sulfur cluster insertion protein ErpA n=1 Tax=Zavarzinia compransoris TaxID=1264899 RepID=A0A317EBK3_9PROT|nr:iron-sulfur cluster insertion protein ErpA [Zavarzinia compransoris]PWR23654.1 iron-sulfur cluster insertion protein ErpA [Zavarzinia compransoris]TDP47872.1 iron-sulfur cluster insertion protein [Zavarzinia compransoris]